MTTLAAEITGEGWALIITALGTAVVLPLLNIVQNWRNERRARLDRQDVKTALERSTGATVDKLDAIAAVGDSTHALVNNAMTVQLRLAAVALRRVAGLTKDPADIAAADQAEAALAEHEMKQRSVDAAAAAAPSKMPREGTP